MKEFITHTGETVSGERLREALNIVANKYADNAKGIRQEDFYASHVTEEQKDKNLENDLNIAESIRAGKETGFWVLQRLNTVLTGECIAMLPR